MADLSISQIKRLYVYKFKLISNQYSLLVEPAAFVDSKGSWDHKCKSGE